jgi:hypothetical protein
VVVVVVGIVVDVVEGDLCMKKDQSVAAEKNRRRIVQRTWRTEHKSRRTEWAADACWKTVRKSK